MKFSSYIFHPLRGPWATWATLALLGAAVNPLPAALFVNSYNAIYNDWDRTQNEASTFIGKNFDFSGVGRSDDGWWATMIHPSVFLSANHAHPGIGSTITFFVHDASGNFVSTVTRTVASGQRVLSTDLWAGELSSPVPSTVKQYSIFTGASAIDWKDKGGISTNQPDLRTTSDVSDILFMVGRSAVTDETSFRVGLGVTLNSAANNTVFTGNQGVALAYFQLQDFSYVKTGDSGGPTFFAPGTNTLPSPQLLLFGIHAGNATSGGPAGEPAAGSNSFDSIPGWSPNLAEINDILAGAPIPEPAVFALLGGSLALLWVLLAKRGTASKASHEFRRI